METIKQNVKGLREEFIKDDNDYWLCIDGKEGVGKTTLGLDVGYYYDPNNFNVENIAMDGLDFLKKLKKAKKGSVVLWDESASGAYSKESINRLNLIISKASMFIRGKNLFVILILPSFFVLDKYLRLLRIGMLWRVTRRGEMVAYGRRSGTLKKLSIMGSKFFDYGVVRESFSDTYPNFPEINEQTKAIYKDYLVMKKSFMNDYLDEAIDTIERSLKDKGLCEVCGRSNGYVAIRGFVCRKCGHVTPPDKLTQLKELKTKIKKFKDLKDKDLELRGEELDEAIKEEKEKPPAPPKEKEETKGVAEV